MDTNGITANPFIPEENGEENRERLLWVRFFSGERAHVGRPRKGSDAVTWQQLGISKRTAHRIRTLGRLSPQDAELVATRKMTLRQADEQVHGPRPVQNPLFTAWRRATSVERRVFLDALEEAGRQAAFFAEREDEKGGA